LPCSSTDSISSTVQSVLGEFLKTPERTIFWDDKLNANVDPFIASGGGFFTMGWDFKVHRRRMLFGANWTLMPAVAPRSILPQLKVLRQLVDLQLTHAPSIKVIIDRAWGVVHNKHKKREMTPPPGASDPQSRECLQLLPIGQDSSKKRYWTIDGPCTSHSHYSTVQNTAICAYLPWVLIYDHPFFASGVSALAV
jgi:hypothetical protein